MRKVISKLTTERLQNVGAVKHGTATLEGSGQIEFAGSSSADVTFGAGSDATLKLDVPPAFKGTVAGFAPGDYIDLPNINFADSPTLCYSTKTDVLTVRDNLSGVTDTIKFEGSVGYFTAQNDGKGGILISDLSTANMLDDNTITLTGMHFGALDPRKFQCICPANAQDKAADTTTAAGVHSTASNLSGFALVGSAADQAVRVSQALAGFSPTEFGTSLVNEA